MRRRLLLILVALVGGAAHADDGKPIGPAPGVPPAQAPAPPTAPAPAAAPAPPLSLEQVADAVLSAIRSKDDVAVKALAQNDAPDPWLVADELILRGEFDAADTLNYRSPDGVTAFVTFSRAFLVPRTALD